MHLQLHKAFDHMTRTAQRAFRWKPYKMKKSCMWFMRVKRLVPSRYFCVLWVRED